MNKYERVTRKVLKIWFWLLCVWIGIFIFFTIINCTKYGESAIVSTNKENCKIINVVKPDTSYSYEQCKTDYERSN